MSIELIYRDDFSLLTDVCFHPPVALICIYHSCYVLDNLVSYPEKIASMAIQNILVSVQTLLFH